MTQPETDLWICVTNSEQRWSVWPADLPIPAGWLAKSEATTHAECVELIEMNWSDQRPRALRESMA